MLSQTISNGMVCFRTFDISSVNVIILYDRITIDRKPISQMKRTELQCVVTGKYPRLSDKEDITLGGKMIFQNGVPGTKGQPPPVSIPISSIMIPGIETSSIAF